VSEALKIICENRKARFDYHIEERMEAGIVLTGTEIKSLRGGKANLNDAYATINNGEAWLMQAHIAPYDKGGYVNHEPKQRRKLLLHTKEIAKLYGKTQIRGYALIPMKIYFKKGRAKIELALAVGKNSGDKREAIKKRETQREVSRALKSAKR
jgi:SsrA-binding protein